MIEPSVFKLNQSEIDNIKQQMQESVDGGFIPGALILVGNSDGVGLLETAGFQTSAGRNPVNSQTIFRIYSMTKPIVSVAAMSLIEDGLLALDDPIEKYIPEFSNLQVIDRESGEVRAARNSITVENLLTHESGLIQAISLPTVNWAKCTSETSRTIPTSQHGTSLAESASFPCTLNREAPGIMVTQLMCSVPCLK